MYDLGPRAAYFKRQAGATLIELLVSVVIGLIVAASMLGMYVTSTANSSQALKTSKLHQELTTLMTVMVNDIRRAGYWKSEAALDPDVPNPFSSVASTKETALMARFMSGTVPTLYELHTANGDCILYAYDRGVSGSDGVVDTDDIRGFKLEDGSVLMLESGSNNYHNNDCSSSVGSWLPLTDDRTVSVDVLQFDLEESSCLNTLYATFEEPNNIDDDNNGTVDDEDSNGDTINDAADCFALSPSTDDITVLTRQVKIVLEGYLSSDPGVRMRLSQYVRVRNDMVTVVK